ncbi:MAG: hypothetical protein IT373_30150 [Polyangiaceae bacterium]|nr:hypothetical protein [Polyangiaceae bacterium]
METKSLYAAMLAVMGLFVALGVGTLSALARFELPGAAVVVRPATDDAVEVTPDRAAVYGPTLPVEIELPAPAGGRATPLPPRAR